MAVREPGLHRFLKWSLDGGTLRSKRDREAPVRIEKAHFTISDSYAPYLVSRLEAAITLKAPIMKVRSRSHEEIPHVLGDGP